MLYHDMNTPQIRFDAIPELDSERCAYNPDLKVETKAPSLGRRVVTFITAPFRAARSSYRWMQRQLATAASALASYITTAVKATARSIRKPFTKLAVAIGNFHGDQMVKEGWYDTLWTYLKGSAAITLYATAVHLIGGGLWIAIFEPTSAAVVALMVEIGWVLVLGIPVAMLTFGFFAAMDWVSHRIHLRRVARREHLAVAAA